MPRFVCLAACAVIPVMLAWGEAPPEKPLSPSVAVFMDFDSKPGDASVEVMKKEADGLLKPAGINLNWRLVNRNEGKEAFPGLVVLKFKGRCCVEGWTQPAAGQSHALAYSRVRDGRVLPFGEVECDEIRQALSK